MTTRTTTMCIMLFLLLALIPVTPRADNLKPYILGYRGPGTIESKLVEVKESLADGEFEIAGEYSPYGGAHIIAVTSPEQANDAALSELGAYGAIQRVSLTEAAGEIQVSYTNPLYFAAAYRMSGNALETAVKLEKALGKTGEFGSEKGFSSKELRKYHYMVMMPYFDDQVRLASFSSQDEALSVIEQNLASKKDGLEKIFRIDIPGKDETVIGVGIKSGKGADKAVMDVTDFGELKHTAHLPYELVVSDGDVYMLHGKFRIALDFPDLTMVTFMKISLAPGGIEKSLKALTVK
ncbi:hypothetical protein ACFL6P_06265 [Candidatus Latescibacterota bacterium]